MPFATTSDGTDRVYKDWGEGPPVVFRYGWPLNSDSWEAQMLFVGSNGFRAIGQDRRGHGRSSQTWDGNEMGTYADDLAAVIDALDLARRDAGRVLHWRRRGCPFIGRHGTDRVAKAALVPAVPPLMLKTDDNPGGAPIDVFDGLRQASLADRSQLYRDLAGGPFFGNNRAGADARSQRASDCAMLSA
jgi:non-heme chloroperoxidase